MITLNKSGKNIKKAVAAIAIIIIAAAAVFLLVCKSGYYLVLTDNKTGKVYAKYKLDDKDTFSITFVHSVNKTPVCDVYEIKNKKIYVIKTIYYGFGAGVQTIIEDGQKLTYGKNKEMIVSGFNTEMKDLNYIVATVSDHTLKIKNKKISLRKLCGRNAHVNFKYKFCLI